MLRYLRYFTKRSPRNEAARPRPPRMHASSARDDCNYDYNYPCVCVRACTRETFTNSPRRTSRLCVSACEERERDSRAVKCLLCIRLSPRHRDAEAFPFVLRSSLHVIPPAFSLDSSPSRATSARNHVSDAKARSNRDIRARARPLIPPSIQVARCERARQSASRSSRICGKASAGSPYYPIIGKSGRRREQPARESPLCAVETFSVSRLVNSGI